MSSLHAELLVYANSTNNEAAWSLYEYCFDSKLNQTKLPDILGCQAEARRLLSPLLMSVFKDYLVHKPLFTNSFCSVTEILPRSGAATEATWRFAYYSRQNKNSTGETRSVYMVYAQAQTQRNPLGANDRLTQSSPHIHETKRVRKCQFVIWMVTSTVSLAGKQPARTANVHKNASTHGSCKYGGWFFPETQSIQSRQHAKSRKQCSSRLIMWHAECVSWQCV